MAWTHVALLRGINVGGSKVIRMSALQACLEEAGIEGVRTYIASGNVLFTARGAAAGLERTIERAIAKDLGHEVPVVVHSRGELAKIVERAPAGFGEADGLRWNVLFCKRPLTADKALAAVAPKPGVDQGWAVNGVCYLATDRDKQARSSLPKLINTPAYALVTIRSWSTTVKLNELLGG